MGDSERSCTRKPRQARSSERPERSGLCCKPISRRCRAAHLGAAFSVLPVSPGSAALLPLDGALLALGQAPGLGCLASVLRHNFGVMCGTLARQRDLLPLRIPCEEVEVLNKGLSRGCRQRINRRLAAGSWAREGIETLWGGRPGTGWLPRRGSQSYESGFSWSCATATISSRRSP